MRKLALLALVAALLLTGCSDKNNKSNLEFWNLKGKVKSVRWIRYTGEERFGKPEIKDKTGESFTTFDNEGNIINIYSDSILSKEYTYSELGKVIEINHLLGKWKNIYEYNDNLTVMSRLDTLNETFMIDSLFYKDEQLIAQHEYFNDELIYKRFFEYDKKGNKKSEIEYDDDGYLEEKITYNYDKTGRVIEKSVFDYTEKLDNRKESQYNKYNDVVKKSYFDSNNELDVTYTYTYEYDSNNNWIKKIVYHNKWIESIQIREIEYYN